MVWRWVHRTASVSVKHEEELREKVRKIASVHPFSMRDHRFHGGRYTAEPLIVGNAEGIQKIVGKHLREDVEHQHHGKHRAEGENMHSF